MAEAPAGLVTCLWFDGQGEAAARFYVEAFHRLGRPAALGPVVLCGPGLPAGAEGSVLTASFTLDGQPFLALNGGPFYSLSPAASLIFYAEDQAALDQAWAVLGEGGSPTRCGWLVDRFGLSWQVMPAALPRWLTEGSTAQRDRVVAALMPMVKVEIAVLEAAFRG
ncbi:VOC family protein [Roseomonas sp. 18066]|uniref:VOC family protein n=1 Tax=Roseomonas sp. 18066 TaxID=2681412 RepID=UPI001358B8B3|nr:VOC family protein [Roseomonas sp. 18066]